MGGAGHRQHADPRPRERRRSAQSSGQAHGYLPRRRDPIIRLPALRRMATMIAMMARTIAPAALVFASAAVLAAACAPAAADAARWLTASILVATCASGGTAIGNSAALESAIESKVVGPEVIA